MRHPNEIEVLCDVVLIEDGTRFNKSQEILKANPAWSEEKNKQILTDVYPFLPCIVPSPLQTIIKINLG